MLKSNLLGHISAGVFFSIFLSSGVLAGEFTDDFSSGTLAAENWSIPAYVKGITPGEKFWSKYSQSSTGEAHTRNRLRTNTSIGAGLYEVKALLNVKDLAFANNSTQVFARIEGLFYTSSVGVIWAALYIGEGPAGTGMRAWWVWDEQGGGDDGGEFTGLTPAITMNKEYYVKIAYDGAKTFTFTIADNDGTTNKFEETVDGPVRAGPPSSKGARLSTGGDFAAGGDGSAAYVEAEFDNAEIKWNDGAPQSFTDSFAGSALKAANWRDDTGQAITEQSNGPLVATVSADGVSRRHTVHITLADTTQNCLYAESTWHSDTNIPDPLDDGGRIRVVGYWYNDRFEMAPYNGIQGNVFAAISINSRGPGEDLEATANVWLEDPDILPDGGTGLYWEPFTTVPVANKSYPMSIELDKDNKKLKMIFNGETKVYDITTPIFDVASGNEYKAIQVRIQDNDGDDGNDVEGFLRADIAKVISDTTCPAPVEDDFLLLLIPSIMGAVNK